ncbi:MAG: hypothetical protein IPO18_19565 [bacterium]|nr:hypothetical protein [bacterium]
MYRELEARDEKSAAKEPSPDGVCPCACGEPAPADDGDSPAGNRTAVTAEQYWEYNG